MSGNPAPREGDTPLTHRTVEDAARLVVETSAGLRVLGASHHGRDEASNAEVVATLSLLGARSGTLVVSGSWGQARAIANGMLGPSERAYDEDTIRDAMGELANQVAGTIKRAVAAPGTDILLSPPVVVSGSPLAHGVRATSLPVCVDLEVEGGSIRICLWSTRPDSRSKTTGDETCSRA